MAPGGVQLRALGLGRGKGHCAAQPAPGETSLPYQDSCSKRVRGNACLFRDDLRVAFSGVFILGDLLEPQRDDLGSH